MSRDPMWEAAAAESIRQECLSRYGFDGTAYATSVAERLAIGAERYGDDSHLDKDNVAELLEETPDVAAYCFLEIQKRMADGRDLDGEATRHLWECIMAGALADFHARKVREFARHG